MEDLILAAGVLAVIYFVVAKKQPQQLNTLTPAPAPPFAPSIGGQVVIGDSYGVAPFGTILATPGATSPTALPSTINSPPGLPPPGGVVGGIGGDVGTGGLPLGGPIIPGVSTGTGTANGAGVDIFGRGYGPFGAGLPGYDVWGRKLVQ
jgi:hypothetical protein